jgi:hypothetical protein
MEGKKTWRPGNFFRVRGFEIFCKSKLFACQSHSLMCFTMKSQRKRLITFLCLSVLPFILFPVKAAEPLFPIGLELTYQITDEVYNNWTEQYEILRWAPELGTSVLTINFSSTKGLPQQNYLFVDISSWMLLYSNGSEIGQYLQPPLWVNTSLWQIGNTVQVPTYAGTHYLSQELYTTVFGTYPCWQAYSVAWFSIDDDYQLFSEHWYFHHSYGLLIKYTNELLASQHAIHTYRFTHELITSNLYHYGISSIEEQAQILFQSLGLAVALFLPILLVGRLVVYYFYHTRKHR